MFELPWVRFALSGTLILVYALADRWIGRARPSSAAPSPRWVRPLILVSILGYYALIGPTGGPLLGGIGNVGGVGLVAAAILVRRFAPPRRSEIAARSLFYVALPMAVGVPWGWLVLTAPACLSSLALLHAGRGAHARPEASTTIG
jgi:hypothetical protein